VEGGLLRAKPQQERLHLLYVLSIVGGPTIDRVASLDMRLVCLRTPQQSPTIGRHGSGLQPAAVGNSDFTSFHQHVRDGAQSICSPPRWCSKEPQAASCWAQSDTAIFRRSGHPFNEKSDGGGKRRHKNHAADTSRSSTLEGTKLAGEYMSSAPVPMEVRGH
jgi:hypothetical protein